MSRPVLFVIDDDAGVVRALRGDLSRRFGEDFRVIGESSAAAGLAVLRVLAGQHVPVALLIAGHDTTEMAGVDFLVRAPASSRWAADQGRGLMVRAGLRPRTPGDRCRG